MIFEGIESVSKSQANARKKQSDIVQAARSLFLEIGFGASSMDAVANLAGVTKQTVYRYFPSKEELFSAVMESIRDEEPAPYAFGDADLETELYHFGLDLLAFHLTPAALGVYKLMLREGNQENLRNTFMKTGPNRVMQRLTTFLSERHPTLDGVEFYAQMFANLALAPRNRLIMQDKGRITRAEQEAHVKKVVKLFLQGMNSIR